MFPTAHGVLSQARAAPEPGPGPTPGLPSYPDGIWLESLFLEGLQDGDPVLAWEDASARAYDLASLDTAPVFRAAVTPTGAPVVRAAGASRLRGSARWRDSSQEPLTYFLVAATTTTQTFRPVLANTTGNSSGSVGLVHWYPLDIADGGAFKWRRSASGGDNLYFGRGLNDGVFRVFTVLFKPHADPAQVRYEGYLGKTLMPAPSLPVMSVDAVDQPLCLFGEPNTTNLRFAGDVAAVLWYRGALEDADREAVVDYLTERYITPG